jgi:hypothetical protein
MAVVQGRQVKHPQPAPASFNFTAIVPVFNEADVIGRTLQYLIDDGISVYVIDN